MKRIMMGVMKGLEVVKGRIKLSTSIVTGS